MVVFWGRCCSNKYHFESDIVMIPHNKSLRDIIKEEYVKCAANPVYFMKKYSKIQHPVRGKILFELWDFQEDVLRDFQNHRYNICLKSRQLGISTLIAGYSLWLMLFQTDQNVLVIATKQETAKNLVTKARVMYDNLPSWLKTGVVEDNKLSLRFKNGSQIKAVSAAADAARSEALSLLIIDEGAFIDNIEEIWASAQSTINTGGSAIINSTPNGVGNFYHKQWVNAKTGRSAFNPIFLHWTVHPERDQSWRDEQDIILGPALAAQECFTGNVRVITKTGWVPIKDIQVDDEVLSHTGKFQRVIRKYVDDKNNLYGVKSSRNHKDDCFVTSNHPIAVKNGGKIDYVEVKNIHSQIPSIYPDVFNGLSYVSSEWLDGEWDFESIDTSITKTVYNLEVENDNTYVTEFGLVHNCDGDFLSSGHSVVDGNTIDWYEKTYITEPKEKRGAENGLWIWDYPDPSKSYMIAADVARGDGKDYSTFHIMDIENVEQVAEYQGKLDTKSFGNLLVSLATEYNDALLVIENANIGWAVIQQVIDRGYPNLYYTYKEDGYTDPSVHIPKGYDLKDKSQMVPGFTNSSKTRPLLISKYEMYFRERSPIIKSSRLTEEMFVFIWNGGRAEAQSGYNDDLVMSFAIGLWVRDTALKLRQDGMMRTKMALDYIKKSTQVFNSSNMRDIKKDTGWAMDVGNKKDGEDLTWLL